MDTFWKIVVTFGVLGLFVLVVAFVAAFFMSGMDVSGVNLGAGGKVAVVPVYGTITLGGCPGNLLQVQSCAQVDNLKKLLREADNDPSVKAIVLDVYSGGGNVVASRELMREVKKTKKPVVAWISEVGASGAYYVASAADEVVADENSLTGSIGVIMFVQHYYELFDDIGINVTVIKAGQTKDIGSPYRPMTDSERENLKGIVDGTYERFVEDVAENREMTIEEVREVANGDIYLGSTAYELGLVDELGGMEEAIDLAARLGGIKGRPEVKKPERKISLSDILT